MSADTVAKGIKLLHLYRRGVGGERTNAGRLLLAYLRTHDLTFYDLDPSLPVSQELALLDSWRESSALFSKLGTAEEEHALTQLVDAPDLTPAEMERLLGIVDLEKLIEVRADGWAYRDAQADPAAYRRAGARVLPGDISALSGSLAQRLHQATARAAYFETHPRRVIRAEDPVQQHFLLGLVQAVSGQPGELVAGGVQAHLDADQLARLRALQAHGSEQAQREALAAARRFGEAQG